MLGAFIAFVVIGGIVCIIIWKFIELLIDPLLHDYRKPVDSDPSAWVKDWVPDNRPGKQSLEDWVAENHPDNQPSKKDLENRVKRLEDELSRNNESRRHKKNK